MPKSAKIHTIPDPWPMSLNIQLPWRMVWVSVPVQLRNASVHLVWRERVKQLSTTPLNSFKQGKSWQRPCIMIWQVKKLWLEGMETLNIENTNTGFLVCGLMHKSSAELWYCAMVQWILLLCGAFIFNMCCFLSALPLRCYHTATASLIQYGIFTLVTDTVYVTVVTVWPGELWAVLQVGAEPPWCHHYFTMAADRDHHALPL